MSSLIKLSNIVKIYRMGETELTALNHINLEVSQGELLSIMGASGSGKSTLLNILGILDRPTRGQYYLNDQEVSVLGDDAQSFIRNHKIGFVFQSFFLLPRLNALENVTLPLSYRGIAGSDAKIRAMEMLDRFRIAHLAHHKPNQLSGGQQQRVAIARALIGEPELIIADEPTGALDSATGQEVMAIFNELHVSDKKTVIIVTHDSKVAQQCKRVVHLKDGRIISDERVA